MIMIGIIRGGFCIENNYIIALYVIMFLQVMDSQLVANKQGKALYKSILNTDSAM